MSCGAKRRSRRGTYREMEMPFWLKKAKADAEELA